MARALSWAAKAGVHPTQLKRAQTTSTLTVTVVAMASWM
jgi:hypothetical protein